MHEWRVATHLLGTSNTTYPTKKTTREMEYWFDVRFKSASMPDIFAFPMLFVTPSVKRSPY